MEKRKNRPIWALFIILLVIVLIGMTCEFSLKLANSLLNKRETNPPQIILNQILRGFGDEAIPLWAIPTLVLNWMSVMPRNSVICALRWLPYLGLFLLPVLCALIRKQSIPLIICAAVNGIVAVGIMLVHFSSSTRLLHIYYAVPFMVEAVVLILACIAIGSQSKGFSIFLGIVCVLLALFSPVISAGIHTTMQTLHIPNGPSIGRLLLMQARRLPLSAATSYWPIYKAFVFFMYALILFFVPSRFVKHSK